MLLKNIATSRTFFIIISLITLFLGYSQNMWRATDYRAYFDSVYSFLEDLDDPELSNLIIDVDFEFVNISPPALLISRLVDI